MDSYNLHRLVLRLCLNSATEAHSAVSDVFGGMGEGETNTSREDLGCSMEHCEDTRLGTGTNAWSTSRS